MKKALRFKSVARCSGAASLETCRPLTSTLFNYQSTESMCSASRLGIALLGFLYPIGRRRYAPRCLGIGVVMAWMSLTLVPAHADSAQEESVAEESVAEESAISVSGIQQEMIVEGTHGAFTLGVHPDIVTMIAIPEKKIGQVFSSVQGRFLVEVIGSRIMVRPRRVLHSLDEWSQSPQGKSPDDSPIEQAAQVDVVANMHIEFDSMMLSLTIHVVDEPMLATSLAVVRHRSSLAIQERLVADRVTEEVAAERLQLAQQSRNLVRDARVAVREQIGRRLLAHHKRVAFDYRERNRDNVILWLESGIWIGADLYLLFELQNRSPDEFRFSSVRMEKIYTSGGQRLRTSMGGRLNHDRSRSNKDVQRTSAINRVSSPPMRVNQGDDVVDYAVIFPAGKAGARDSEQPLMSVESDARRWGVICIADANKLASSELALIVTALDQTRSIEIRKIQWH